ncbi:MAG: PKD domain-containing protein [Chitinophagaceae bacterium]|nr:PKD domain-containing protein [Chitinophagaceae bacterium]
MGLKRQYWIWGISILLFHAQAKAQAPLANFTASPLSGCSPLVVNFTDLSTNTPTSWAWDFGTGATSSAQNPTTTFFNPGTYTVVLTATNAAGFNTLTRTAYITVYEAPSVQFIGVDSVGCYPLRTQFTDQSQPGAGNTNLSWDWSFGDGAISTQQNPSHRYDLSGNYSVTLRVTNDKGCTRTLNKPQYIQVSPGVDANFTNTSPNVCQPPVDISFNNLSTGPGVLTYSWNFGDGNVSTQNNPIHTYTNPGNYDILLVATSSLGCVDSFFRGSAVVIDNISTDFSVPDSICINESVQFLNISNPVPQGSVWDFGDGGTSTAQSPTKSYAAAGTYAVKLINNFPNCQDSITKNITVVPFPVADFTAPVTASCQPPLTVNFQDISTGGAVAWNWDFGDGGTSTQQNPSHTYTSYGSYTVTLIATNSTGCSDTIIRSQYIRVIKPVISFPDLPVQGCIPFAVNFSANITTVDAVTSYLWTFGDGGTSTLATPSHTYTVLGNYTVSLTITTSTGCTETLTLGSAVKAGTPPTVNFSATPLETCVDQPVQFTELANPADAFLWDFGNGDISTQPNPLYSYPQAGVYTIKLVARNSGCPDSLIRTDYVVIRAPQAFFTYTIDCNSRNDFVFTDRSDSSSTWLWDFGDGVTSTLQNPSHSFPGLGTYTVSLTVTYGACQHTYSQPVRVLNENPDLLAIPNPICKEVPALFHATNTNNANIATYTWNMGDGTTLTGNDTVNHAYVNAGNYTIRLITTDVNGCLDTVIKTNFIRVNGPQAAFIAPVTGGCQGLQVNFQDQSTTDGVNPITQWQWNFGDGTIQTFTGPPFQHIYADTGTFSVQLIVTDQSGCRDTVTRLSYITTSDPSVTFSTNTPQTCPGSPVRFNVNAIGNGITYLWDFGDGNTSTQAIPAPPHSYANTGQYTVKLTVTDQYGCADSLVRPLYISVDKPRADFQMEDSISSCSPFEVKFTNNSTYYYAQTWDFGDGTTSTVQNPTHYYSTPGTYQVRLIIQSAGTCFDTLFKTVQLYDTIGTRIAYAPFAGCKPQSVDFIATTNGPLTYIWDFGDGQTLATTTPALTHVYNTFGSFVPRLILEDQTGCLIPVSGLDTIHITGAEANFGIMNGLYCDSGTVQFIDSTTSNDPITQYQWDFGDGGSSTATAPSHFYASPGIYSVSLAVQTLQGCTDTLRIDSLIRVVASPQIAITGDVAACVFSPILLNGILQVPDTSQLNWQWSFSNGNNFNGQSPGNQTFSTPGTASATLTVTNSSGCVDTAMRNLRIHPLPTVSMPSELTTNAGQSIQIPAVYSGNMTSYAWTPPSNLDCTDCPQPFASPGANTNYNVQFLDSNGCAGTGSILIKVKCENANVFLPNTFSPNNDGRNDVFFPRGTGIGIVKVLRIFNRWGEVVFEKNNFSPNASAEGWDGNYKGKVAGEGVYIYQLEVYCQNGELIKLDGNVALIK